MITVLEKKKHVLSFEFRTRRTSFYNIDIKNEGSKQFLKFPEASHHLTRTSNAPRVQAAVSRIHRSSLAFGNVSSRKCNNDKGPRFARRFAAAGGSTKIRRFATARARAATFAPGN
jgi:hypothetical protein